MCYSAMVEQKLKSIGLRYKARIQSDSFEDIFHRRVKDDTIKIPKALEANFEEPETPEEARIKRYIDAYRERRAGELEAELFKQKKRLADATRTLVIRETRKAIENQRIANHKIEWHLRKLAQLRRTTPEPDDSRIFPFWYAPVLVREAGQTLIRPMRYHCRANGSPESIDRRYPGLYNARRDNLEGYWKTLFGRRHAVALISSFYENVALNDYEKRALREGEKERNIILHFNPRPESVMLVACLWDCWKSPSQPDLYSFAAITDEPPPEVAATGHNRCVIPLKEANLLRWLEPEGLNATGLYQLLDDRERPYYEHGMAA
ncbi:MAG: SOS response-associated peptidase family protein [Acidiferrobacterales bacterium]